MRTTHRLIPRNPASNWSAVNKKSAEHAIATGSVAAPGRKAIERTKANGRWNALDKIEKRQLPTDLEGFLRSRKRAKANFSAFPRSVRRGILEWIDGAKTMDTRKRRLRETADKAAKNERAKKCRKRRLTSPVPAKRTKLYYGSLWERVRKPRMSTIEVESYRSASRR